ncbi:thioredoxin-like protein [Gautieria morchelliformis]|nr:thioredoxin-like protein [Gautieria morchelliformis]
MTSTSPYRTIKVSIICDITCPWCYIGATEIDRAIERLQLPPDGPVRFELEHKPYVLNPSWKEDEWRRKSEYLPEKIGKEKWEKVQQMLRERGKEVGINFQGDGIVCSTWRAHRLLLLAWNNGGSGAQSKLLKALYQASFEREENISDVHLLAKYAEDCGFISQIEAIKFLESDELMADVKRMVYVAQRNGVSGVPFTVIDGRWAISGGQSSDVFYEIFDKLAQGQEP